MEECIFIAFYSIAYWILEHSPRVTFQRFYRLSKSKISLVLSLVLNERSDIAITKTYCIWYINNKRLIVSGTEITKRPLYRKSNSTKGLWRCMIWYSISRYARDHYVIFAEIAEEITPKINRLIVFRVGKHNGNWLYVMGPAHIMNNESLRYLNLAGIEITKRLP